MDMISNSKRKPEDILDNEPPDKKLHLQECDKEEDSNITLEESDVTAMSSTTHDTILSNKLDLDNKPCNIDSTESKSPYKSESDVEEKSTPEINECTEQQEKIQEIDSKSIEEEEKVEEELVLKAYGSVDNSKNEDNCNTVTSSEFLPENQTVDTEAQSNSNNTEQVVDPDQASTTNTNQDEAPTTNTDIDQASTTSIDQNQASTTNTDQDQASSTTTQTLPREKCKYGEKCYRKNPEHKSNFSHPGDADYDTPDNRPECPYGTKCYRKNPQHKIDYKHTRAKRKAASKAAQKLSPGDLTDSDESVVESVDESDYEASFIDDDDDDEDSDDIDSHFEEDDDDGAKCEE